MDQFRETINIEMSTLFDKVFNYFKDYLGNLENKVTKLEKELKDNNKELSGIKSTHNEELENVNSKYKILEEQYTELKADYENYKKVSIVKTLHKELDEARHEIEILKQKLEKDQITLTIENDKLEEEEEVEEEEIDESGKELEKEEEKEEEEKEEEEEEEEEEKEEEIDESDEEVEFIEKRIRNKVYYVTDDDDKEIYEKLKNGDLGDLVGKYVGKRAKFFKK